MAATVAVAALALSGCTGSSRPSVDAPELASGELSADAQTQIQQAMTVAIEKTGASGGIVGVWVPWAGSWVSGIGTTATGSDTKVTADMSFRAGEITREMTCDALYGMVDDKIVKLSDTVSKYVSGLKSEKDQVAGVTLEQLCDSTTGVAPVPATLLQRFTDTPDREWRPRELASFGLGQQELAAPGEKFINADTNYILLGLALEKASGLTASAYIEKYVTKPLGLEQTVLPSDASATPTPSPALTGQIPPRVDGSQFNCAAPIDATKRSASSGFTNSGVTSTVADLATYARALAAGSLSGGDTSKRFDDPLPVYDGANSWWNTTGGSKIAGPLIGQTGGAPGYSTSAFSDPESGLTVVIVINSSVTGAATAELLGLQIAAIASKIPATSGKTAPESGLPWTADTYGGAIAGYNLCAPVAG